LLSDEVHQVMPEFLRVEPGAEVLHAHLIGVCHGWAMPVAGGHEDKGKRG
jgi:hypothetical protein